MPTATANPDLTIEAHHCANGVTFTVTFTGPDADARCVTYMTERGMTHAFCTPYEADDTRAREVDLADFPLTFAHLNPICEHGLALDLCYGPQHYATDAEIAAGW